MAWSSTWLFWRRAVRMAASLSRLARSAPEKPGVRRAQSAIDTSSARGLVRAWTERISSRPERSGRSTLMRRSKRPGRSRAVSRTSRRLVAASRITPELSSKPSISVRSWLRVCSRSSLPPPIPAPRWRPTASISSMKMMQGALALAWRNRSRTRLAPTPTNISTNSVAAMEKKGTPASPAMARARSVLPVPGGPTSSTPFGIRAPMEVNCSGVLRKVTTSCSSSLASAMPATSSNRTVIAPSSCRRGWLRPNPIALLATWAERRTSRTRPAISRATSRPLVTSPAMASSRRSSRTERGTLACSAVRSSCWLSLKTATWLVRPSLKVALTIRWPGESSRLFTFPAPMSCSNWL